MGISCLLIPRFAVRVEQEANPRLQERPVLVIAPGPKGRRVADASEEATGVVPGMPLSQALSHCPAATVIPSEPPRYQEAWNHVLDHLENLSPVVEDGGLGCAYLDTRGLANLYGGEARLADALLAAVPPRWQPRLGMAPSKFPAYLAATTSASGQWSHTPSGLSEYMSSFPVEVLSLSQPAIARLRSFGLHTLGQVAGLPLSALQAQFGPEGELAWELAHGIDRHPLTPRQHEVLVRETIDFLAPVTTVETLLLGVERLLGRAFARKELRGRCARLARLEAEVSSGPSLVKRIVFKEPVASKSRAFFVLKKRLAGLRLPGPVEAVSLTLSGIGGEAGRQASLFSEVRQRENLRVALGELRTRFGGKTLLYQVREMEPWSRIPERRWVLAPYGP